MSTTSVIPQKRSANTDADTSASERTSADDTDRQAPDSKKAKTTNYIEVPMSVTSRSGSSKFSDLDIICGDHKFKVHKAIVCNKSAYFKRVVGSNFREAAESSIDLSSEPLLVVRDMLHHLYPNDKSEIRWEGDTDDFDWAAHEMALYTLAQRVELDWLRQQAAADFSDCLDQGWEDSSLLDICREVYSRLPQLTVDLRVAICKVVVEHFDCLVQDEDFKKMLENVPALGTEVALHIGKDLITVYCTSKDCERNQGDYKIMDFNRKKGLKQLRCLHCGTVGKLTRAYPEREKA